MIAVLDNGGFAALVPVDERSRARLRVLQAASNELAMSAAVQAEGLLTGDPGHDHHARKLLELVRIEDVDRQLGTEAGYLRLAVGGLGRRSQPSGVDAMVVALAGPRSAYGRRSHPHQRRPRHRGVGHLRHERCRIVHPTDVNLR